MLSTNTMVNMRAQVNIKLAFSARCVNSVSSRICYSFKNTIASMLKIDGLAEPAPGSKSIWG